MVVICESRRSINPIFLHTERLHVAGSRLSVNGNRPALPFQLPESGYSIQDKRLQLLRVVFLYRHANRSRTLTEPPSRPIGRIDNASIQDFTESAFRWKRGIQKHGVGHMFSGSPDATRCH